MGSFDRPGQPGDPEPPEGRGKGGDGSPDRPGHVDRPGSPRESESERADRLGLSTLTREDAWRSQRAEADAQEAALERPGPAASRESAEPAYEGDSSAWASHEGSEPELGPGRDAPGSGADHWALHRPEGQPEANIDAAGRYYWTEVPRFLANWWDHARRWPGMPAEGRDYDVTPELRADAKDEIAKVPQTEPPVSDAMRKAEDDNHEGGWLAGFEFRLKGSDRLLEKALEGLEAQPGSTANEVVSRIPDAIRYTFCFDQQNYTSGCEGIRGRLESSGYRMYYCKNSWTDAEYKGINTRWVTPEGQRFEVQFHTRESFHAKHEVTHHAYERLRDPRTSRSERRELKSFQRDVSSWIPVPKNVIDIRDYKEDGF